jgi:nucleoside phosphorylase
MTAKYDIGIIIPLQFPEWDVFSDRFDVDGPKPVSEDSSLTYYDVDIGLSYDVFAYKMDKSGTTEAARIATEVVELLTEPSILAVLGIGGGVDDDVKLGDVVVADVVQEYDQGAAYVDHEGTEIPVIKHTLRPYKIDLSIREYIKDFRPSSNYGELYEQWQSTVTGNQSKYNISEESNSKIYREDPRAHLEPIGSGGSVLKSQNSVDKLKEGFREVAAVDMEAAGVWLATEGKDIAPLAVRGISDYPEKKTGMDAADELWRKYAMYSGTEYLYYLLKSGIPALYAGINSPSPVSKSMDEHNKIARKIGELRGLFESIFNVDILEYYSDMDHIDENQVDETHETTIVLINRMIEQLRNFSSPNYVTNSVTSEYYEYIRKSIIEELESIYQSIKKRHANYDKDSVETLLSDVNFNLYSIINNLAYVVDSSDVKIEDGIVVESLVRVADEDHLLLNFNNYWPIDQYLYVTVESEEDGVRIDDQTYVDEFMYVPNDSNRDIRLKLQPPQKTGKRGLFTPPWEIQSPINVSVYSRVYPFEYDINELEQANIGGTKKIETKILIPGRK